MIGTSKDTDASLRKGAFILESSNEPGEAYYIRTPGAIQLYPYESITIDTGIRVTLPYGYKGVLRSIYKYELYKLDKLDKNVVIDELRIDGTGNESISVTIHSGDTEQSFFKGDIIAKLVILSSCTPELEKQYATYVYKMDHKKYFDSIPQQ